ncbi:MAG: methylmalonyl-CoA mutase family protein, partial [Bacteroidota bacterium]
MNQEKKAGLFAEFPEISTQQWEEIIHKDLKGADYEKKLIWNTLEGLKIKPYYRSEDHAQLRHLQTLPGQYPFVRGNRVKENDWEIRQDIIGDDLQKANNQAVNALKRGAEAIGFNVEKAESAAQLRQLLNGINPAENAVHLLHSKNYKHLISNLASLADAEGWEKGNLKGSINFDPLGYFMLYGSFYDSAEKNFEDAIEILSFCMEHLPALRLITVNGQHFHNAGAHCVQELAFALAQGNEYLAKLTEKEVQTDDLAPRMQFTFAVGSNYFLEIAKLRAARILWAKIVEQYNPQGNDAMKMYIHAVTS